MGAIIIAMPRQSDAARISDLLQSRGMRTDAVCTTGAEALQKMTELDYGILICTSALPDMGFLDIAEYMPGCFKMLLMTKDPDIADSPGHIVTLLMPFRVGEMVTAVQDLLDDVEKMVRRRKPAPPKRSEEEKRTLDRAKKILMERQGMTEPESYRYLQKCSMDSGIKLVEAAEMVLLLYEE